MKAKGVSFDLFRYQILPRQRFVQKDIFGQITSLDELLARKNDLFFDALKEVAEFQTRRTTIKRKVLYEDRTSILYKFAANRSLKRETEHFTEEAIENWPSVYVYIWNEPEKQIIAVQERGSAFQQTHVVARAIADAVERPLGARNLRVHVEALFHTHAFWELVNAHKGKLRDVRFELITPNMSNISEVLSDELKDFAKGTNAAITVLDIQSDPDSTIVVSPENEQVQRLVSYASEGGGNISMRIRGLSKRVHTEKSKKQIDLSEMEIQGQNPDEIVRILREMLQ